MTIGNFPVWPFAANWGEEVRETLEWLTDVIQSPTGAEQRRTLRKYPRRMIEFNAIFRGRERSLFDNLMMQHGGREWYLPVWIETHLTSAVSIPGGDFIPCPSAIDGELFAGDIIFLSAGDPFVYELAEIESISVTGITTINALSMQWGPGTRVHPVRKSRFTDQPAPRRSTDNLQTVQVRFMVSQNNNQLAAATEDFISDIYRGIHVLSGVPDETEQLENAYVRMFDELENQTGLAYRRDTANLAFTTQSYGWILHGREQHKAFRSLAYFLKGRATPVWLPTFFQDLKMVAATAPGESFINFENVGFTESGGISNARRDICVQMVDGTRHYRRITASALLADGTEAIGVDAPFVDGLQMSAVLRISFMALFRLDQDQIEIVHHTDSAGTASVATTFRSAPALRQEVT